GAIEQLVSSRVRQWLRDPGSIYQATRLPDAAAQRRLVARAAEISKSWREMPGPRQRAFLTALIERIDVATDQINIHIRPTRLGAILDVTAQSLSAGRRTRDSICAGAAAPLRAGDQDADRPHRPVGHTQTRCAAD